VKTVSTATVAKDMGRIVDAYGRGKRGTEEGLMYWGLSYGTVLGATFASMFPDKVERMVLDGVDDIENYYKGSWGVENLVDIDRVFRDILENCAGSERCALYGRNGSAEEVWVRVERVLEGIERRSVGVMIPEDAQDGVGVRRYNYGLVDREMARKTLYRSLFDPRKDMLPWFDAIRDLEAGDGKRMFELSGRKESLLRCERCDSKEKRQKGRVENVDTVEMMMAIACSDAEVVNPTRYLERVKDVNRRVGRSLAFGFGNFWMEGVMCSGWKVRPGERFTGTIGAVMKHPILMIGNTADAVCPLHLAKRLATRFPGSVVLTQNSTGVSTSRVFVP